MRHVVHCLSRSDIGGAQQVVCTLAGILPREYPGTRISVVLPPGGVYVQRFASLGIATELLPLDTLSPHVLFQFHRLMMKLKPDIIHSHGKGAGLYARLLRERAVARIRIHSYHGFHPPGGLPARSLYLALERKLLRAGDGIVAVSESEAAEVRSHFPRSPLNITVIPNCVDAEAVGRDSQAPLPADLTLFLARHHQPFVAAILGRNDPVKDFPLAFDAFRNAAAAQPALLLLVIGVPEGDPELGRLRREFPERIYRSAAVENPAPIIRISDCLLCTSKKEGSPLTVLEGFALRKPVVATDVPGLRDVVTDGINGILCRRTQEDISGALVRLSTDRDLYARLVRGAEASARGFTLKEWAGRYESVYASTGA